MKKWVIPGESDYTSPVKFPYKIILTACVIIFVLFTTYNVLTWPQDKKVTDDLFFNAFTIPAMVCFGLWCMVAAVCRMLSFPFHYANNLESYGKHVWQSWAIESLVLLNHSSLSPVPDLSLKIQKLEGEAPISPATPLKINIEYDVMNGSRIAETLFQLIEPVKDSLSRGGYPFQTWLYVKNSDESIRDVFIDALSKLKIAVDKIGTIHFLDKCPDYSSVNKWIDQGMRENNILITIELHDENNSDFYETAHVFVFTDQRMLNENDKPAYLLRMMNSTNYHLAKTVNAYLSAKQVQIEKIRRLWTSSLDKQSKFILYGEVDNAKTGILADSRYELEKVTGQGSDVQNWTLLALAIDATEHGQGHQIIATSEADNVHVGLVTAKNPGYWNEPYFFDVIFYAFFTIALAVIPFIFVFVDLVPSSFAENSPWLFFGALMMMIIFILVTLMYSFHLFIEMIHKDFGFSHPNYR
ncbi:hypothetical protein MUU48_03280 [Scandinavium sp. H11S7]|uniref:hypothetical protein n=1 Tax=Scandinavium hiltneri TaxID=2926519 RepID=UPI002165AEDC|nr:hypothetical protein [Scandinavium hiltneri]MCS2155964.1 hypothetical protein [Scandinavium hiltneri]